MPNQQYQSTEGTGTEGSLLYIKCKYIKLMYLTTANCRWKNIALQCVRIPDSYKHYQPGELLLTLNILAPNFVTAAVFVHTHTRLTALFPGVPRSAGTRKPIWILLAQETVSDSGISWAICKSAPCSRQITTPVPHHSVFTGQMPFLPPNQQRQSTEGILSTEGVFVHIIT